jgi:hypothetical protein
LKRLVRLKEVGLDVRGDIPEYDPEASAYAKLVNRRMRGREENVGASSEEIPLAAGTLHIYLVRDPNTWDHRTDQVDRYSNDLEGSEWIGLFRDTLRCPMGIDQSSATSDELTDHREKYRLAFQKAIPQYSLLGRLWDTYADAVYEPAEVSHLRDECSDVRAVTADFLAAQGLDKLIQACDAALKSRCGIYVASD